MSFQELEQILKLLYQYSGNPLLVALVVMYLLDRRFVSPVRKIKDWLTHYIEIHEEDLFTGGRIEKLVREILSELKDANKKMHRHWWQRKL